MFLSEYGFSSPKLRDACSSMTQQELIGWSDRMLALANTFEEESVRVRIRTAVNKQLGRLGFVIKLREARSVSELSDMILSRKNDKDLMTHAALFLSYGHSKYRINIKAMECLISGGSEYSRSEFLNSRTVARCVDGDKPSIDISVKRMLSSGTIQGTDIIEANSHKGGNARSLKSFLEPSNANKRLAS